MKKEHDVLLASLIEEVFIEEKKRDPRVIPVWEEVSKIGQENLKLYMNTEWVLGAMFVVGSLKDRWL